MLPKRGRRMVKNSRYLSGLVLGLSLAAAPVLAAERLAVEVTVGGASVVTFDKPLHQLIVGNPAVADVSVENARTVVVFGKQRGGTTLTALDASGKLVLDAVVVVNAGGDAVSVTWGAGKDIKPGGDGVTYVCGGATCAKAVAIPDKNAGGSTASSMPPQ